MRGGPLFQPDNLRNERRARQSRSGRDRRRRAAVATFAELAEDSIARRARYWRNPSTERAYRQLLDACVQPHLGGWRVDRIDADAVARVVRPHWQGSGSKGGRILWQITAVMNLAVALGYRGGNPAPAAPQLMPVVRRRRGHHPGVPHGDVAAALARIRAAGRSGTGAGHHVAVLALELLIFTAARPAAVREASSDQFDLERRTWTIPAERMASGRRHVVPLSRQAMALLDHTRRPAGGHRPAVPVPERRQAPAAAGKLPDFMRQLQLGGTPYGFRAGFRAWAAGVAGMLSEQAELTLGHAANRRVALATARATLVEACRPFMQRWADHVAPDHREDG